MSIALLGRVQWLMNLISDKTQKGYKSWAIEEGMNNEHQERLKKHTCTHWYVFCRLWLLKIGLMIY